MIEHALAGEVELWHAGGDEIAVLFERSAGGDAEGPLDGRVEARWSALRERNPRLFDGPICAVSSFDPVAMRMSWRASRYRLLAVQDEVETGTWQLSVTVLLVADRPRVLIGRRSGEVHTYPGLWEFGPSGGVDPPAGELDREHLLSEARREIAEEIGTGAALEDGRIVGVLLDRRVRSYDVLIRAEVGSEVSTASEHWEYDQTRWATVDELAAMEGLSPPSALVASHLGALLG